MPFRHHMYLTQWALVVDGCEMVWFNAGSVVCHVQAPEFEEDTTEESD
jgi:hypothetical protein